MVVKEFIENENLSVANLSSNNSSVRLTSQNIDLGASTGNLVYYNYGDSSWIKAANATPLGIYNGNNIVVLKGLADNLSGLTAGEFYYSNANGELTTSIASSPRKIKVGYAISTTSMLVDIDHVQNTYATDPGFGNVVFSSVVGERNFGSMVSEVDYTVSGSTIFLHLDREYIFSSFELKSGATLSTNNTQGTALIIKCIDECIISGTVNLKNKMIAGNYSSMWTFDYESVTYNSSGTANGGSNWGSISPTYKALTGFGIGGSGWPSFVTPGNGGTDGPTFSTGGSGGYIDSGWSNTGSFFTVGGNASVNSSAGGGGGSESQIDYNFNTRVRAWGGVGGSSWGSNGSDGSITINTSSSWNVTLWVFAGGGGGAGGIAGKAGVHLIVTADIITFDGSIDLSGTDGSAGGDGGRTREISGDVAFSLSGSFYGPTHRGIGGSGGGGGNSGNVYFRYETSVSNLGTATLLGGNGGEGKPFKTNANTVVNTNTKNGDNGINGLVIISQVEVE